MGNEYDAFFSWKALAWGDKCREIAAGGIPAPVILHVYPTNECNRNCRWCIMRKERREHPAQLPVNVFVQLLRDAERMGVQAMQITGGGEPLLYPYLCHVREFKKQRILATNGVLLTREYCTLFDRVRVSVNAGTPETYARTVGVAAAEWENIVERLQVCGRRPRAYEIGLGFVADYENWTDIPHACALAAECGLDFVHIRPAYYPLESEEGERMRHTAKSIYHMGQGCRAQWEGAGLKIVCSDEKFEGFWTERKYTRCRATPLHAVVTATGELVVCLDVFIRFGNLHEQRLGDIWGSEEHREALGKIDLAKCPRCVMGRPNEIIENVFLEDKVMLGVL
jgi:MoaA/NifB/PqqE/SkfB family radical SAM enzyme